MRALLKAHIASNRFEIGVITVLLLGVSIRGAIGLSGTFVAFTHALTLLLAFILLRGLISRVSETAGRLFFIGMTIILMIEGLIQFLTGLHVNWFVISLLLQDNSTQNIGVSFAVWGSITFATFVLIFLIRAWIGERQSNHLPLRTILLGCIVAVASGQTVYSIAHYNGAVEIMHVKRSLPFFFAPHPYYAHKILGHFTEPSEETPFAKAQVQRLEPNNFMQGNQALRAATNKPHILLIVADSIRASELQEYPELTPTLSAASQRGYFSLNQYSVSNCTHFSFYSMFTGRIATTFGEARQNAKAEGLVPDLISAGYHVTTAESISLDWYDIEKTIFPENVNRWIVSNEIKDNTLRDIATTERTIETLATWPDASTPQLHITYLEGSHFPYSQTVEGAADTMQERYHASISLFDERLAELLTALEAQEIADDTLVIITSDHGDELLSEGRMGHSSAINDNQTLVPLLILGGNQNTENIRSHLDIRQFVLNQLAPDAYPFAPAKAVYLANCDYDYPKDFQVIMDGGRYSFDYDDGYLVSIDSKKAQSLEAATLLVKTIQNGGIPQQP